LEHILLNCTELDCPLYNGKNMRLLLPLLFLLVGSALPPAVQDQTLLQGEVLLESDTFWQGEVVVDGEVTVATGATLNIAPGTNVRFVRRDADRNGLGDATIIVKGSLVATGTEQRPIRFLSAESDPKPADWLEIRSDFAKQLLFDWCEFRDSAYTLHAHFTRGHMRNSHIHLNIDGCRLGRSRFLFQHNLVENNSGKGINFRDSEVTLIDNIIRDNRAGIFLFEKPGKSVIGRNNIYRNEVNLQLGDFFAEDVSLAGNWWGSADLRHIAESIHDRQDDSELGQVETAPVSSWLFSAGIERSAQLKPLWSAATAGFIDAAPLEVDGRIFVASWDGFLRAFDPNGELIREVDTGDVIDGGLLAADGYIYLQNWARQFLRIDQIDGQMRQLYSCPPSPADDHRQAGINMTDQLLLLPAWNGTLYAFDRENQNLRWQYAAGMPLRATPLVDHERIYLPSGSKRLSALSADGHLLWEKSFSSPLLAAPVISSTNIFLLEKAGILTAMKRDGVVLWQYDLGQPSFYSAPLVAQGALFVATAAGDLWKFDPASGQPVWKRSLGGSIYASPVYSSAGVLVGDNDGILHLVDFDSGRTITSYRAGGAIQSQVLVTGNRLYFGSRDRNLHALQLIWKETLSE
jgi:parallel beta-helix repeat protein